eukprot:964694_1
MLKFLGSKLSLMCRTRLVRYFNAMYLSPMMYYKVTNIDSRISNPDQALTDTINEWSIRLSGLYSDITKPTLDILLFSYRLSQLMGIMGPLSVIVYYFLNGIAYRLLSPPFGKLVARSEELEGEFRTLHNRLMTYSEEVAFYGGHKKELDTLNKAYRAIECQKAYYLDKDFYQGILHGFLSKYGSFALAYSVLGMPMFGPGSAKYRASVKADTSIITGDYIRNSNLYINLAQAVGRIVVSYSNIQKLAGYTTLVSDLQDVLTDLDRGKYVRPFVNPELLLKKGLSPGHGVVTLGDEIKFHELPIVTPNGDILAERVTLTISDGMNLMIVGPNGCGKSSLFRILAGLWPVFGGHMEKPRGSKMFYIPQKPYLTSGTLRDQVIYPHSRAEFEERSNDSEISEILEFLQCRYIAEKPGGWDLIEDWPEVLSGGEKQQLAMARLMYHRPKYAILDECTSAISVDLEAAMYTRCGDLGINLITVSHRPSLWKYHGFLLKFDGLGGWEFGPMVLPEGYHDQDA